MVWKLHLHSYLYWQSSTASCHFIFYFFLLIFVFLYIVNLYANFFYELWSMSLIFIAQYNFCSVQAFCAHCKNTHIFFRYQMEIALILSEIFHVHFHCLSFSHFLISVSLFNVFSEKEKKKRFKWLKVHFKLNKYYTSTHWGENEWTTFIFSTRFFLSSTFSLFRIVAFTFLPSVVAFFASNYIDFPFIWSY